ncbi:MAG: response regulator transcription factor [Anaerolineaceae bacterium]|nr:response regulator transcription factor [Anaerolineaceae bacterium]MCB9099590.1 response regulator transcription factor [Anaerolineales bacterium]
MAKIQVVLVDDHPLAREGLRNLLNKAIDIEVIGEADDGVEALHLVETLKPDVLVLDMEMPGLSGVEVAQQLKSINAPVRVLALSAHNDKGYIMGLLANGAAGYLVKEEMLQTIVEAVRGVARGEQGWLSRQVSAQISTWTQEAQSNTLTPREMEVLALVVEGKTNQEIGLALGISEKTVEKHLVNIFAKLAVSSRVEAAVYAVREGLV